jgi:hypothetical protein
VVFILTDFSLCSGPPKHGYLGLGEVLQSSSGGNTSGNKQNKKDSLTTFSPSSKLLTLCVVTIMLSKITKTFKTSGVDKNLIKNLKIKFDKV